MKMKKILPYIQIMRPFVKWLLPFTIVLGGAIAAYHGFPLNLPDLSKLIICLIAFCPILQGICIRVTNDIFDYEIDKINFNDEYTKFRPLVNGSLTKREAVVYAIFGHVLVLILTYYLNFTIFLLTIAILFGSFTYSSPIIHAKKIFPLNNVYVGIFYSELMFLAGWRLFQPITFLAIIAATVPVLMGVFGSMSKDYADVYGDKRKGVKTLPIIYGIKKAARINVYLILLVYVYLGVLIVFGLLPVTCVLIFIGFLLAIFPIYKLLHMNFNSSLHEKKVVVNVIIFWAIINFILVGISLAIR